MVRVKICGVTNLEDALFAVKSGADAIGFVFYSKSKRYIPPEIAREISFNLPPFVSRVGVFVNEPPEKVLKVASFVKLSAVQLHGSEDVRFCEKINEKVTVIKAFGVSNVSDIERAIEYKKFPILLDTKTDTYGGSGKTFDWSLILPFRKEFRYLILSGGLNPDNVEEAVRKVKPFAVDVSSGVEVFPGKKDHRKVEEFIKKAKGLWK
ncbi:phosphoribosylanthranilate isomerase [Thermotoga sp. KOL6]|uniref:phosphoribosylanthranilate isomerase n=1 Tax=Thermotoga sp. KOL6 TaxID=126741 RepID=UPI000C77D57F|nr:phosphoribosylanthranilate isomerase [Thermotoga sp. KOL6]PLV58730.1 N-(5'-phosphoribosyl)anthranilate isomerase [Thermotoga sp. KOL6]